MKPLLGSGTETDGEGGREEGSAVEACANNGGGRSIFEADHESQSIPLSEVVERK